MQQTVQQPLIAPAPATFSVHRLDDIAGLAADVHDALAQAEQIDFQGDADWYELLRATALNATEKPQLSVLRRDGIVAAALPLVMRQAGRGCELHALANFYTTRYTPWLAPGMAAEDLARLFRTLLQQQPGIGRIDLSPLDKTSAGYPMLRDALRRAGLVTFEYFCFGNWYLPVTGSADAYMAARPGEVRSTLRRMTRRLDQAGARIELIGPHDDVEGAIAAYAAVYASSWKQPEPFADFMPGLIRLCARKGWLRMGIARLADRPIAAQLWVVANGRASIFKLAYDEAFASYSPGTVLTAMLMRHVLDVDRVREVDYMTGDDAYKQAWMSHRREMWGLVAYNPRQLRGALLAARELSARAFKRLMRRH